MLKKRIEKQCNQLLEYFKEFQHIDLLGFGRILDVEEKDNFEDYVTNILVSFISESGIKRKQLLKLAKDIVIANRNMVAEKDSMPADKKVQNCLPVEGDS